MPDTPHDSANSHSGSTGSSQEAVTAHGDSAAAAPSAVSDFSQTVGALMPNGSLSALRLNLDRPLQARSAQMNQDRNRCTSPKVGARRPSDKTCKRSLSLLSQAVTDQQHDTALTASSSTASEGDNVSVFGSGEVSQGQSNSAELIGHESASGLSSSAALANHESASGHSQPAELADQESTSRSSGSAQASTASSQTQPQDASTMAQKAAAFLGSGDSAQASTASSRLFQDHASHAELPPLPDLLSAEAQVRGGQTAVQSDKGHSSRASKAAGDSAKAQSSEASQAAVDSDEGLSSGSSKYVQIGCAAVAYVCLAAIWAKSSSAVAFASYFFPT